MLAQNLSTVSQILADLDLSGFAESLICPAIERM
jgi:hypothetical protein